MREERSRQKEPTKEERVKKRKDREKSVGKEELFEMKTFDVNGKEKKGWKERVGEKSVSDFLLLNRKFTSCPTDSKRSDIDTS